MLRVSQNPVPRFPEGRPLEDDLGNWWVLRTRPRNEKALAGELTRLKVGYYLPLVTKRTVRRDNGKPRKSVVCLFPGYLSVVGYPEIKQDILRSGRVLGLIQVKDQARFVAELGNVERVLQAASEVELMPGLAVGRQVLIASGPLGGVVGVVTDCTRPGRVHLNVEMFNQTVTVSVQPEELVMIDHGAGRATAVA